MRACPVDQATRGRTKPVGLELSQAREGLCTLRAWRNAAQRGFKPTRKASIGWFKVPPAVPLSQAVPLYTRVSAGISLGPPRFVREHTRDYYSMLASCGEEHVRFNVFKGKLTR